jgi:membrane protein insertase Oxa1/YidC/SpoIIIJ
VPAQVAQQIQQIAHATFAHAFVDAMRPTMVLPIAVLVVTALATAIAARGQARPPAQPEAEQEAVTAG